MKLNELFSEEVIDEFANSIVKAIDSASEKAGEFKRVLNQKQAAEYIGVSAPVFADYRKTGLIKPVEYPGFSGLRFDKKILDKFIVDHQL